MKNRQPAEWALHQSGWTAWPSDADLWAHDLTPAREEVGAFIRAVDDGGNGEVVEVLAANEESARDAEAALKGTRARVHRSEEHTSELQSLMRISYAVFCLKKKNSSSISQISSLCLPFHHS